MTLVLNGTTGVSAVDGSAATPAIQGNDSNTGIFFPAADTIAFATAGTEDMRIDSAGNVGIGTTDTASGRLNIASSTSSGTNFHIFYGANGDNYYTAGASGIQVFRSQSTERMRIAADGVTTFKGGSADLVLNRNATSLYWQHNKASSDGAGFTYHIFQNNGSGIGSISFNGSGTSFNTTSDYRLKENVQPMTGALDKVAALKPCTYTWKADGSAGEGFIAHELAGVAPQCVAGAKDAIDENGNPVYQGIDTSFLVATLTAAIQEQQALIAALQADVAALKGQA